MNATIQAIREDLAGAAAHQVSLGKENSELAGKIQEASRQAALEKARNARAGEQGDLLLAASTDLDLEELRRREQALPLEIWAAHLQVYELSRDLDAALSAEAGAEAEALRPTLEAAQRDAKAAEERANELMNRYTGSVLRSQRLARQVKDKNRKITDLESAAPVG